MPVTVIGGLVKVVTDGGRRHGREGGEVLGGWWVPAPSEQAQRSQLPAE
jgi:hypothetical protein